MKRFRKNNTNYRHKKRSVFTIFTALLFTEINNFMSNTSQEYDAIVAECRSLFVKKMSDYGAAWRILRLPSLTDQIFIKAQRIRQLQENSVRKVDEGEKSEFIGIINYSVMALIQLELGVVENLDLTSEEAIKLYDKHISIKYCKLYIYHVN